MVVGVFGILVILVPLIAGILLIVFSRSKGKSYPACGKCGYDISGSVGSVIRCPECGMDFTEAGITPPGGKRNPFMLVGGILLIVMSLGCVGSLFLAGTAQVQRQTIPRTFQPNAPVPPKAPAPPNAPLIDDTHKSEDESDASSPP